MKIMIMLLVGTMLIISCTKATSSFSQDEIEIRKARQRSNEAIAHQDTLALAEHWTEDFHIISSRNFETLGRIANQHSFALEFSNKKDVIYVRTPEKIEIFKAWNMAAETGTWTGQWQEADGTVKLGGSYYAKWHFLGDQWKIRAEVFTPLYCSGSKFCDEVPEL